MTSKSLICGALLLKPDMSHLETYPDLYCEGETYISHGWDLDDLSDKVASILENYDNFIHIAQSGQSLYRHHVGTKISWEEFADRFSEQIHTNPGSAK
jgi:hypothetical protein